MFACKLKTVKVLQHADCQGFAKPAGATEEDGSVQILQFGNVVGTIEINLVLSF